MLTDQFIYKNLRILILDNGQYEVVKSGEKFLTLDEAKQHIDYLHENPETVNLQNLLK